MRALLPLYLLLILLLVALPLNSASELNDITVARIRGDYWMHALLFLPWASLCSPWGWRSWSVLGLGLLVAAGSESLQYFLPYRAFNINDMIANGLGVILGWGLVLGLRL